MNKIILSEQNIECGRFCEPIETILQVWKGLTAEYKQKDAQIIEHLSILCASTTLKPSLKQN